MNFFEISFGISPDGGSGWLELGFIAVGVLTVAMMLVRTAPETAKRSLDDRNRAEQPKSAEYGLEQDFELSSSQLLGPYLSDMGTSPRLRRHATLWRQTRICRCSSKS